MMKYMEVTIKEAIEMLKNSKGDKVLMAVHDLTDNDEDVVFSQKYKKECEEVIKEGRTITSEKDDDYFKTLNVYTTEQKDIFNIKPKGLQSIILLKN